MSCSIIRTRRVKGATPRCCGAGGASSTRSRQLSASSIASTSGRREVSDEDVAEYAKQLVVPRYGAPRVFVTSAKQGV